MLSERDADQQLVERVQKGDKRAFDLLVLKYQHRILALVSRFVRDPAEVQDVAQEAFIKAYRALPNFRGESAFFTWLYRIAINTSKNYLVSRGRRPSNMDTLELDDDEDFAAQVALRDMDSPEELLYGEELRGVVNQTLRGMPEELRTALLLRERDGLSYEEIAEAMSCPVGTVRSRIFRARESVDKRISDWQEGRL